MNWSAVARQTDTIESSPVLVTSIWHSSNQWSKQCSPDWSNQANKFMTLTPNDSFVDLDVFGELMDGYVIIRLGELGTRLRRSGFNQHVEPDFLPSSTRL